MKKIGKGVLSCKVGNKQTAIALTDGGEFKLEHTNIETAKRLGIDLENPCADGKTFPVPKWEGEE